MKPASEFGKALPHRNSSTDVWRVSTSKRLIHRSSVHETLEEHVVDLFRVFKAKAVEPLVGQRRGKTRRPERVLALAQLRSV